MMRKDPVDFAGNVDVYGYSSTLGGVLMVGWIDLTWDSSLESHEAIVFDEFNSIPGGASVVLFTRDDVKKFGNGFVMFVRTDAPPSGAVTSVKISNGEQFFRLVSSTPCLQFDEEKIFGHVKQLLAQAAPNEARARLYKILERPIYKGHNTLDQLQAQVHLEVDTVYFCPPRGFVLFGWYLDPFEHVASIRLRGGRFTGLLDPKSWIVVKRPDVIQGFAQTYGFSHDKVGFVAFAHEVYQTNEPFYAEIELKDGRVGFRPIQPAFLSGMPAIKEILGRVTLRSDELNGAYDNVLGPAMEAMNTFRLKSKPDQTVLRYGRAIDAPRGSIIVPLYGRMDFMEYQLAFFSNALASDHEIIYVLDDPDKGQEAESLAAACFAKFERPFDLIVLSHNMGYAPANNIGLRHARGEYICFLNSDVFPANPDWLEQLISTERSDPTIGIVGALLTYEDGALQHRGCTFERLPEFGGWPFPMHPDKGRRVALEGAMSVVPAVTGACMVLTRELANRLGGFDEGYIVGDFEDVDLCFRARELGLKCVVDYRAQLYHLERQSQGQTSSWRMNLTLHNAWRFQKRWQNHEY